MANNMNDETDAIAGVVLADRATQHRDLAHNLPSRSLRAHLSRLPGPAPAVVETPLIETDTAPGFSALRQISVHRGPIAGIAVDARDGLVYAANPVDNSVSVLDPSTLRVIGTMAGLDEASAIAAAGGRAFVATATLSNDAVTALAAADDPVAEYPLAASVGDLAVDTAGRYVYVARSGRDGADVAVIDTVDGRVRTLGLGTRAGAAASAITISPDGARVYVVTVDDLGGELVAIDTATRRIVGGLAFPAPLRAVAAGPGGAVYVATCDLSFAGLIDVIDGRTMRVTASIDVGGLVTDLVAAAAGDRLYVAGVDRVSVVCTATHEIVDTVTIVSEPSCLAESADGRKIFIADYDGVVTALTVSSCTASLLGKMMASDFSEVLDIQMLELERAGA